MGYLALPAMPRLFVLSGPDLGKSFDMRAGDTLGRSPECIVTLRDASVSRQHARLDREGERWFLVDTGSRNGISQAGVRLPRIELQDGSEVALGEVALRFRTSESAPAPAPETVASRARPARDLEQEIELEGAGELEIASGGGASAVRAPATRAPSPPSAAASPALAHTRSLPPPRLQPTAATAVRPPPESLRQVGHRALQYHRSSGGGGLLGADLAQLPVWLRCLALALALALASALFLVAFRGSSWWSSTRAVNELPAPESPEAE
jgi:hypothetical protein